MNLRYKKPIGILFSLPALAVLYLSLSPIAATWADTLDIYYSASLNGNLDGCNCDMNPVAGLVKRAAFLRSHGRPETTMLVDAGDILDELPDEELARHIFEVYRELGYAAIAVGDQEFSNGLDRLLEYRRDFPLICHNLFLLDDQNRWMRFSQDPTVVHCSTIKVGIIALLDPGLVQSELAKNKEFIRVHSPVSTAHTLVCRLADQGISIVVLLYHGPCDEAEKLIERCPGIDVVVLGHEQRVVPAWSVGKTIFVSPGEEGNWLGMLRLDLHSERIAESNNRFRFFSFRNDPDDPSVRLRIQRYRESLRAPLLNN